MSGVQALNKEAEVSGQQQALVMNITAARSLSDLLKTNLGPKGTLKMLVSGGGDVKLTKDGNVLLKEMAIQHPTAGLIARSATAVDDIIGDGTTTQVLLIGELLHQTERFLGQGVHPRALADGFDLARAQALQLLEERFRVKFERENVDTELLTSVARSSLLTKLEAELAEQLTEMVVDAVLTVRKPGKPIDLFMVEIMTMQHKRARDTQLVKGLVLDHGARHPNMPKALSNVHVMTLNVSLEYEKTEINTEQIYSSAEQRDRFVLAERNFIDERVRRIVEFKRSVCKEGEGFLIVNQKGIDPMSLDMLQKEGILALRRAKRRNMERLTLSAGGMALNSVDDELTPDVLGFAERVWQYSLGEEKYTFVDGVRNPQSCTILIRGPHAHGIQQIKDAVRDGLRAVKNTVHDASYVAGAGSFEIAMHAELMKYAKTVKGRARLGVEAFAEALLIIPKTLAQNSGLDPLDTVLPLIETYNESEGEISLGVDVESGEGCDPTAEGIYDLYRVKRQVIHSATVLASQLLLVDQVLKAGVGMGR